MKKQIIVIFILIAVILTSVLLIRSKINVYKSEETKSIASTVLNIVNSSHEFQFKHFDSLEPNMFKDLNLRLQEAISSRKFSLVRKDFKTTDEYGSNGVYYLVVNTKGLSSKQISKEMVPMNDLSFFDYVFNNRPYIIDSVYFSNDYCYRKNRLEFIFFKNGEVKSIPKLINSKMTKAFIEALNSNNYILNSGYTDGTQDVNIASLFKVNMQNNSLNAEIVSIKCALKDDLIPFMDSLSINLNRIDTNLINVYDSVYIRAFCFSKKAE
jgi:hypothetical protein